MESEFSMPKIGVCGPFAKFLFLGGMKEVVVSLLAKERREERERGERAYLSRVGVFFAGRRSRGLGAFSPSREQFFGKCPSGQLVPSVCL
jgi:hypothetical protein